MGCVTHECTRFLYRLRKRSYNINGGSAVDDGGRFRYLLVYERHKSGALHTHALIHTDGIMRYSDIRSAWNAGFMDAKLCDLRTAGYITKYATKDLTDRSTGKIPRIRASRDPAYGGWVMNQNEEELQEMLAMRRKEEVYEIWEKNLRMVVNHLRSNKAQTASMMMREMIISKQSE